MEKELAELLRRWTAFRVHKHRLYYLLLFTLLVTLCILDFFVVFFYIKLLSSLTFLLTTFYLHRLSTRKNDLFFKNVTIRRERKPKEWIKKVNENVSYKIIIDSTLRHQRNWDMVQFLATKITLPFLNNQTKLWKL